MTSTTSPSLILGQLLSSPAAGLIGRVALASPFALSGVLKLSNWRGAVAEFTSIGVTAPELALAATTPVQLLGSLLLLTSRHAWAGAVMLSGFTAAATLVAHRFRDFSGPHQARHRATFFEHIAIIGGLAAAAASTSARHLQRRILSPEGWLLRPGS